VHHVNRVAWQAMPIVPLITFLIGCIIAQQGFFHFRGSARMPTWSTWSHPAVRDRRADRHDHGRRPPGSAHTAGAGR
jgi:hypothetical protein